MDNSEILKKISSGGEGGGAEEAPVRYRKLVVFLIDGRAFAFDSDEVKEVVIIGDLYFIPFVPPYVAGLINRHGEPHTVLDLKVIMENEKLSATKALIMHQGNDQIAFLITDIEKIISIPEHEVRDIPAAEGTAIFRGSFTYGGNEVFIINAQDIYDRLRLDIKNI